ncbi:DNA polymerase III subunit alpha [Algimonas porphyrae]|uniref:DNA polymerase III subunit alpha n=1 Tax=Algimonas porphyrae TaxID=1128113 RepID=A0ABQ5UYA9_9PROT|nr:DNA polymerase III subunit alpha [Algimonas porphyrae]GLQ20284.1 DNA polymerase III subunit alpha [Algimonas porphyrae]
MIRDFVHLRMRSPYSLLEGALKMKETADRLNSYRQPAIAITDTNNLCGALEFSEVMVGAGIQPIIGVTLSMDLEGERQPGQLHKDPDGSLVLLAQNETGYENLMALSSEAFLDVDGMEVPHIKASRLTGRTEGVIALTGGTDGALDRLLIQGRPDEARRWLSILAAQFPNALYVELQRHGLPEQSRIEPELIDLAYAMDLPLVATNDPYFLGPEMYDAHDTLLAMSEGSYVLEQDRRKLTTRHYLKSSEEMLALFSDLPEALANTLAIAQRCAFRAPKRKPILPHFGDGSQSEDDILSVEAHAGLEARLESVPLAEPREVYFERLEFELNVIREMGFPGYFLIVSDFIKWAKAQNIPVGPGRGSGAGSVVAWALTITDLDPLRFGLLFERFLNPERVSMPDFDIDFCQERRGEVIDYVRHKYGDGQVAQIITFGTLQARAVVRDVGRVMQMPLGQVDRLAKLVPNNPASPVTLQQAINMESALQDARRSDPTVRRLLDTALSLEGLYRNASTHAAGVVIGDRPLTELVPLYRDPRSEVPATQFTMKWAEKAGLVKFDFLGLKTLTVIDRCLGLLRKDGIEVDLASVDTSVPEPYKPLADGLTAGVFQLESSGMRDALRKLAPDSIEELTAIISLYRPGPMRNIPDFIERKFGRQDIRYPHPKLQELLEETYGIIIYQEQVMEIAKILSGFSLGDADLLRRAMGKKDQAEMDRQRDKFIDGAVARGVDRDQAAGIFDLVNEFAGYGFNKSHAAAYAMISFQTAYLKALYPAHFLAAIMSLDLGVAEKLAFFFQEAKRIGVEVQPPCVNRSMADFDVKDGKVLYALGALKNVGLEAMKHVVSVRESGGLFTDIYDFARRVDMRIVNKRAMENLARSGAFDGLGVSRATALASAEILQKIGALATHERESAQVNLFGGIEDATPDPDLIVQSDWSTVEALEHELGAVGFYFGGHPLDEYLSDDTHSVVLSNQLEECVAKGKKNFRVAGIVRRRQERSSKHGKRFAYLGLSDPTGEYELFIREDLLFSKRDTMSAGNAVICEVRVEGEGGDVRFFAQSVSLLSGSDRSETGTAPPRGLRIRLRDARAETLDELEAMLCKLRDAPHLQSGVIELSAPLTPEREARWQLSGSWAIDPGIRKALKANRAIETIEEIAA